VWWKRTHKFGIKIEKNVPQALLFDQEDGNMLYGDTICKEIKKIWEKDVSNMP
jgi:hypothetical protein